MKTNINTELFKKYAPKKKLEIIESLTQEELLAITPKTVTRIVKETGEGKKGSPNKYLKIRLSLRQGNNWNSTFDGVGVHSKRLYVSLYVQWTRLTPRTPNTTPRFLLVENGIEGRAMNQIDMEIQTITISSMTTRTGQIASKASSSNMFIPSTPTSLTLKRNDLWD